ncbi:MAG: GAF domain-containing protein [Anaerolineales bacterium]
MKSNPTPLAPQNESPLPERRFSYETWRETFLKHVLRGASVLGVILILLTLPNTERVILFTYAGLFGLLLTVTLIPFPYAVRATVFLGAIYGAGTAIILNWGWNADGSLFLAIFAILAALLFDYRAGIFAILLSATTIMTIGMQALAGNITLVANSLGIGTINNWISYTLDMTAGATIANLAIFFLKREFNHLLAQINNTLQVLSAQQASLEDRIRERTAELTRRSAQLESSAFVARQAASIQNVSTLLKEVVQLITDRFGYYHTGIFLADESMRYVTLQAASSEGGKRMLQRGHRLEIGRQGVVGYAAYEKRPRIALDVGADAVFFNNPDLPDTHSEIALPLLVRNKLIGVLDIQSTEEQGFSEEDISTFQSMADQIALAIENARLLTESQLVIEQLQTLTSETTYMAWEKFLGRKNKGYVFSPLGVAPLDKAEKNKVDAAEGAVIQVPIELRGRKIGTITLKQKNPNTPWGMREQNLVHDVSIQVGLALENARLLEQSQKQAAQEQTINTITTRLSQALNIDTLLQTAAQELRQLPNVEEVSVFLGSAKPNN